MSDFKEEEKLKIAPSEQGLDANIENWLETLTTVAKSKFGNYASVIRTKEVPKEWTEELIPTTEEEERAEASERFGKNLDKRVEQRRKDVRNWTHDVRPKFTALILGSLSKESTLHIKARYRAEFQLASETDDIVKMLELIRLAHVQSGRVTTDGDREAVRTMLITFKRKENEKLNEFAGRWALLEKKMLDTGLDDVKHSTKVSIFLNNMRDYHVPMIQHEVVRMLRNPSEAPEIPAIIQDFQEIIQASRLELDDIKSSNKFKVNSIKGEEVINLPDGRIGIVRNDNFIQVFNTSVKGGTTNAKGGKVGFSKNKPNESKLNVTASQAKIANLAVQKGISEDEAKRMISCYRCNKLGHLKIDCKVRLEDESKDSNAKNHSNGSSMKKGKANSTKKKVKFNKAKTFTTSGDFIKSSDDDSEEDSDDDDSDYEVNMVNAQSKMCEDVSCYSCVYSCNSGGKCSDQGNFDLCLSCFSTDKEKFKLEGVNFWHYDNMANIGVFCNKDLIVDFHKLEKPMIITHVEGKSKPIEYGGYHPLIPGLFVYRPESNNNIIPLKYLQADNYVERMSKDYKTVVQYNREKRIALVFNKDPSSSFYRIHASKFNEYLKHIYYTEIINTYDESKVYSIAGFYTVAQQEKAQEAIRLHEAMGHPSDKVLGTLMVSPSIINCNLTPADLATARILYGPCPHCLEGKPQPDKHTHPSFDPGGEATEPGQLLHADIVFINGTPHYFTTDHVTDYLILTAMESKKTEHTQEAADEHINRYKSNLKVVQVISSDHENVLKSKDMQNFLAQRNIKIALRIPGEHEKVAERAMRMVREKMETTLRSLPYTLPKKFYSYLAMDVVNRCNALPNSKTTPRTPMEMVENVKFNILTNVTAAFGTPVLVSNATETKEGKPKNEVGIILGESRLTKGGMLVYVPGDKAPKTRRGLRYMPMTKDIIDYMNKEAENNPLKKDEGLFEFKTHNIEYSEKGSNEDNKLEKLIQESIEASKLEHPIPDQMSSIDPIISDPDNIGFNDLIINHPIVDTPINLPVPKTVELPTNREPPDITKDTTSSKVEENIKSPKKINPKPNTKTNEEPLRRSARQAAADYKNKGVFSKSGVNLTQLHTYLSHISNLDEPVYSVFATESMTWNEAMKGEYKREAREASIKEMRGILSQKSFRYLKNISDRTPSIHERITVPNMILRPKYTAQGVFTLWKARLVSGGHRTDPNVYEPFEKHSPTVPLEVAKLQLGHASYHKAECEVFDIPTAYLNASLKPDKRQVMKLPKHLAELVCEIDPTANGFIQPDGSMYVEVLKALYGFPESAKLWYEYMSQALINAGYKRCTMEPCLFKKVLDNNRWSYVTIYVDDCLHTYKGANMRTALYNCLEKANLPRPVIQQLSYGSDISYLGINISKEGASFYLSQPGYIKDILERYQPSREFATPHDEALFNRPKTDEDSPQANITEFLSILMKLMFLATRTRPDILTAVCGLSTKAKSPQLCDMQRIDRIIGYLKKHPDIKLKCNVRDINIHAYMDAAWNVHRDAKGHSGIIITLGHYGFPIVCKSQKQKVVTRSSTEAELVCLFSGIDILLYIRRIGQFMGISSNNPIPVFQDNTSTITMAYMGRGSTNSNSKYMDLKYFWIKEHLDNKTLRLEYLSSPQMSADFFASPRIGSNFRELRSVIMGDH